MNISTKSRIAALFLVFAASSAQAGILDDDEARKAIIDLRAKVENLTRELNARIDTKADKTQSLEFISSNERMLGEIASLRGQIEVLANEVANVQKRQRELYADLDERIKKLEPREVTIDGQTAEVDVSEQKSYEAAIAMFKAGDYKAAASALSDFVRRYPASSYAANAQYWLGNTYYADRDYKKAIAAQRDVVANYGDSAKAPDALLNIASSYTELKDKKNARKALQDLVAKYPDSSAAQDAAARLKTLK
ncbi:MAG TPA: tol-pal system protein YbgF [Telluria sp.]|nr:tol-pal system protein YbgF [Telluria sp.]